MTLSTMEDEYMALPDSCKEALYIPKLIFDLSFTDFFDRAILAHCDNQSAPYLNRGGTNYKRSLHVDLRYHFCRDLLEFKLLKDTYG